MSVRRFFRLLRVNPHAKTRPSAPDSLAKTAKDALHSRGGGDMASFSGSDNVYQQIADSHERYADSFDKEKK